MKLPEYDNIEEKEKVFGSNYTKITSIKELKGFLADVKKYKNYIFRGVCEAKYKNFTSAQRRYIVNDFVSTTQINVLIQKQIETVSGEHNNLLGRYYKSLGIIPNDLLYLGIAQHYGGISPLLDFSTKLKTALFFTCKDAVFPKQGTDDIGNYSSLYYIQNNLLMDFYKLPGGISERTFNRIMELFGERKINSDINEKIISEMVKMLADYNQFKGTNTNLYFQVPNKKAQSIHLHGRTIKIKGSFSISNLNIVAQNGCFVFYLPTDKISPFESPLHCVDIHKSLIPYIKEFSGSKESDIYPNEYDLVKDSCNKALRNILN